MKTQGLSWVFFLLSSASAALSLQSLAQTPPDEFSGYSLQLNGTNQFAAVPHRDSFSAFPLTLTLWVNTTQTNGTRILAYLHGGYRLMMQDGRPYAIYSQDIPHTVTLIEPELVVADGSWHHLALVVNTNGGSLYLDGNLRATRPWITTTFHPPNTTGALLFGGNPASVTPFLVGMVDEISLWNRDLTAAELRAHMCHPLEGTEPGLLGYWPMNEGTGTLLADASTNHADAFLTNSPVWTQSCIPAAQGALRFLEPSDYVRITDFGTNCPETEVTVEFWANIAQPGQLFSLDADNPTNGFQAELLPEGQLRWQFGDAQARAVLEYQPSLPLTGGWTHLTFVSSRTDNSMSVYRNGQPEATKRGAGTFVPRRSDFFIGGGAARLSDFRVWRVARTAAEIQQTMHRRLDDAVSNLDLYFRMQERAGLTLVDSSSRTWPGIVSGAAEWVSFPIAFLPSVTSMPPTDVNLSSATLNALVVPNALPTVGWFEWGPELERTSPVTDLSQGTTALPFRVPLTGLTAGALYQYRAAASNSAGFTLGSTGWFIASLPPEVDTLPVTALEAENNRTRALLHGTVRPNLGPTTAWFAWGPNVLCRNASPPVFVGAGSGEVSFSALLENLPAESIYHYRLVASNTSSVVVGAEQTFWAPAVALNGEPIVRIRQGTPFQDPGARVARPIMALAAGAGSCLALTYDGRVLQFENGGGYVLPGLDNIVAISAEYTHGMALRSDGRVIAWGGAESFMPATLTNAIAIGAGISFDAAIEPGGRAQIWGHPFVLDGPPYPEVTNGISVDAGSDLIVYLKRDGSLEHWSYNPWTAPPGISNAVTIAVKGNATMVLQPNGLVGVWEQFPAWQPPGLTNVITIANGGSQFVTLQENGWLTNWSFYDDHIHAPPNLTNVVELASRDQVSYALQINGQVAEWDWHGRAQFPTDLAPLTTPVVPQGVVNTNLADVYTLSYSATNPQGVVGRATRTVIVESTAPTPQQLKSNVVDALNGALHVVDRRAAHLLERAISHLTDSLQPTFWIGADRLQAESGARVFQKEKDAALELSHLLNGELRGISLEDVQEWIAQIVQADRLLAVAAVQAGARDQSDPHLLQRVWQEVARGDALLARGQFVPAIEQYRNAWHNAALLELHLNVTWLQEQLVLQFAAVPGQNFEVQASADLKNWSTLGRGAVELDGLGRYHCYPRSTAAAHFFRIKMVIN